MECPTCKKEFDEHTGRRPKKFCSDECKVKYWNLKKKIGAIIHQAEEKAFIETHDAVMEKRTTTKGILDLTKPKTSQLTPPATTNISINTERIAELENELQSIPDVGLGKSRRKFILNQIEKLKK